MISITRQWYAAVFERLAPGSRLLDIGVGTGGALVANADLLRGKDLHVVGVDIDGDYLRRCRERVHRQGLDGHVRVEQVSIFDFHEKGFDAAYFAASFMLIPDAPGALRHVAGLLRPGGRVYFTQTFEEQRSPFMEKAKPLLHRLTTIHFGEVTYEEDFLARVAEGGLNVVEHVRLGGSSKRSWRLVAACAGAPPADQLPGRSVAAAGS